MVMTTNVQVSLLCSDGCFAALPCCVVIDCLFDAFHRCDVVQFRVISRTQMMRLMQSTTSRTCICAMRTFSTCMRRT